MSATIEVTREDERALLAVRSALRYLPSEKRVLHLVDSVTAIVGRVRAALADAPPSPEKQPEEA